MQANLNPVYLISTSMSHVQTEGGKTVDHLYSTHRDVYKDHPHPPFGKFDHSSILQIPAYKQQQKHELPVTLSIWTWMLRFQDCFASTDWNMFWDSSNGIEEYTTSITSFINKCIDDVVPTVHSPTQTNHQTGTTSIQD